MQEATTCKLWPDAIFGKVISRLSLVILFLSSACYRERIPSPQPSPNLAEKALTAQIAEAKAWFEGSINSPNPNIPAITEKRGNLLSPPNSSANGAGTGHKPRYENAEPNWAQSLAKTFTYANGQVGLQVPIHFNSKTKHLAFRRHGTPKNSPIYQSPEPNLLVYKDNLGNFHLEVREFEADQAYLSAHHGVILLQDYSGYIYFYDWQGNFLRGYLYQSGQRIKDLSLMSGNTANKVKSSDTHTTLSANGYCTTVTNAVYSKFCFQTNCGCYVQMEWMSCTYTTEEGPPYLDDGGPLDQQYTCDSWSLEYSDSYQQCTPGSDPYGPGPDPNAPTSGSADIGGNPSGTGNTTTLEAIVETDPIALFPPCPGLTDSWLPLITFKAPSTVINRLTSLTQRDLEIAKLLVPYSSVDPLWQIQSIRNASGSAVNLDMFSVTMDRLPIVNGNQMTALEFLEFIRTNINDFVGPNQPTFSPQTMIQGEDIRWANHEIGSIVSITIPVDNGSVILSDYSNAAYDAHWTFSTLYDPYNGSHPVSGTRTFGISYMPSFGYTDYLGMYHYSPESYTFYIQGADRICSRTGELAGSLMNLSLDPSKAKQFEKADASWTSFINQVSMFASSNGCTTTINPSITNRPNWVDVYNAFQNHRPLSSVPCK